MLDVEITWAGRLRMWATGLDTSVQDAVIGAQVRRSMS